MEWLEITGTSVTRAKEEALVHLGVHESDAEFEVLAEGKIGLFGRVKEEARVRARVLPTPVRPKENRGRDQGSRRSGSRRSQASRSSKAPTGDRPSVKRPNSQASGGSRSKPRGGDGSARPNADRGVVGSNSRGKDMKPVIEDQDRGPSLLEQADIAEAFVQGIAETLGVSLTFVRHDLESGIMRIEANGDGVGLLVGRRGMTAQAIDELVRTVLQRSGGSIREGKIRMDVGGIRARRAAFLTEFTRKVADQVIESREEVALEPMNRMDRKIVHDAVSEIDEVESRSEGEDPNRRVVIAVLPD